ncbi:MAG: lipopolysaccharide transport periplasmic protein LptA [Pseudomonadota bacterium]
MFRRFVLSFLMATVFTTSFALESDTSQPATLDADDFELDLKTGVRIYRGNVVYRQGSIRLDCDELTTYFNDDGELDKGVCTGRPGKFKQRPEGAENDVIGKARTITIDQIEQVMVLKSRAQVEQAGTKMEGNLITYDLTTEKVRVKGGSQGATQTASQQSTDSGASGQTDTSSQANDGGGSSRPSLIIQPRKKKKN